MSPFNDINKPAERTANINTAKTIAKTFPKTTIEVLPTYNTKKSPEYKIGDAFGDRVSVASAKTIRNAGNHKHRKGGQLREFEKSFLVFDIAANIDVDISLAARKIHGVMSRRKNNVFNIFVRGNSCVKVFSSQSADEIRDSLKRLWAE